MDIKKESLRRKRGVIPLLVFSLMILIGLLGTISPNVNSLGQYEESDGQLYSSSSDNILIDKVYTFTNSNPILTFDSNIYLERAYYYHISVRVVTPHECDMKISIFDPEGDRYDITHELNMNQDDYREIPYGAALSGNHSFVFEAILLRNLNVHIKIEKGDKVLEDRIIPDEIVIYNNISKFKTGNIFEFKVFLKSDWYYNILIERVSTISRSLENSSVSMKHLLWDPSQIEFNIFENLTLSYVEYHFGTAIEGIYKIEIIIYIEVDVLCTNIAFAVIEKGKISDIINPNDPDPDPPDDDDTVIDDGDDITNGTQNTQSKIEYSIPQEATIAVIAGIGIPIAVIVGIVVYHKRKNVSRI